MNFILWVDGAEHGPYDPETLQNFLQAGDVSPKVLARVETGKDWKPLELLLPKAPAPVVHRPATNANRAKRLVCQCPQCGSDAIQRARVLYEGGISSFTGSTTGVGFSGIGSGDISPVVARGSTSGTARTLLSQKYEPPKPPESEGGLEASAIVFGYIILLVCVALACARLISPGVIVNRQVAWILFLVSVGMAVALNRYESNQSKKWGEVEQLNRRKFAASLEAWENSWLCHRCGYFGPLA